MLNNEIYLLLEEYTKLKDLYDICIVDLKESNKVFSNEIESIAANIKHIQCKIHSIRKNQDTLSYQRYPDNKTSNIKQTKQLWTTEVATPNLFYYFNSKEKSELVKEKQVKYKHHIFQKVLRNIAKNKEKLNLNLQQLSVIVLFDNISQRRVISSTSIFSLTRLNSTSVMKSCLHYHIVSKQILRKNSFSTTVT